MAFVRLRRLRKNMALRDMASSTQLLAKDLIMPYFVIEGRNKKEPIAAMPGISRVSVDNLLKDIEEIEAFGLKAVLLFGICRKKDNQARPAFAQDGLVQKAIREIKKNLEDTVVITDVCLCPFTEHGHCGIVRSQNPKAKGDFVIDNDATIKILAKIALSHAQAGGDFVAPSAMMDGQVKAIREALDKNGFQDTGILAYSAKYASNFYGPFREALDSSPQFGDRKTYQMDYRNSDEALREMEADIKEGADIVMVKPALAYLDIICRAKQEFKVPIVAYNVSGEYALVKAYSQRTDDRGQRTEESLVLEILTAIKRAGADLIISYHAKEVAKWLNDF